MTSNIRLLQPKPGAYFQWVNRIFLFPGSRRPGGSAINDIARKQVWSFVRRHCTIRRRRRRTRVGTGTWVLIGIALIVLFGIISFNRLVALRQAWRRAFA